MYQGSQLKSVFLCRYYIQHNIYELRGEIIVGQDTVFLCKTSQQNLVIFIFDLENSLFYLFFKILIELV